MEPTNFVCIGILLKLLDLSYCKLLFLVNFGGKLSFAVTLINIIPSSHILGISPFEKLHGYALDYSFFRVFGCTCFVLKPHVERSKLSSQFVIYIFLGYICHIPLL